jgi:putative phage-type endonuclease
VLGLSPYASPYSVWADKVLDLPDDEPNDAMLFGQYAEPMILRWFHDTTGLWVADCQLEVAHPDHPHFMATLDGRAYESENGTEPLAVIEAKSTSDSTWEDGIPIAYRVQVMWQLFVTGMTHAFVPTLHTMSRRFRLYEVDLDPDDVEFIVPRCEAFWRDHVLTGHPPAVDAHQATTAALRGQWGGTGGIVEADITALELVAEYRYHRAQVKAAEADQEQAANRLRLLLGDDTELRSGGTKLATCKPVERTTVDTTALRKCHPDLVRDFERTATARMLRVNEPKEK